MTPIEQKVADALARFSVTFECEGGQRTKRDEWECFAWRTKFTRSRITKEFQFYTGTGHVTKVPRYARYRIDPRPVKPCAAMVLYSLLRDADAANENLHDWCANLGFDPDRISHVAMYQACLAIARDLREIFSTDQMNELRTLLEDY